MTDWSIVQKAAMGSKGRIVGQLGLEERNVDFGAGYWGSHPDGTAVDTTRAAAYARSAFKDAGIADIPLGPAIPDSLIRKAVFEGRYDEGNGAEKLEEMFMKAKIDSLLAIAKGADDMSEVLGIKKSQRDTLTELANLSYDAMEFRKATDTTSNLMHVIADQNVAYLYKTAYAVQALIPTEANKGKTANWDAIAPYDLGDGGFILEDAELVDSSQSPYNRSAYIKYMATVFRVTKAAQFAGLAQIPPRDMLAIRIDAAQDAIRALRERAIIGVSLKLNDTSFAWRGTVPSTDVTYNGIYQSIQANTSGNTATQTWVTSSGNSYNAINNDLGVSYRLMRKFHMMPNLALCDLRTFTIYKNGLQDFFRSAPVTTFHQGISKVYLSFPGGPNGLPMIASEFLPQAGTSASTYGAVMMVDTAMLARRSLWQDMYEDLAKINLSQKGVISAAETFIDKSDVDGATSYQGGVFGITA